jgi:pimeloyl-ACP methyl ester carboxylesterase
MHVSSNGLRFSVTTWGNPNERPVVLLHGFPQEPATWSTLAVALAGDSFRLIAPLQRGYSYSTCVDGVPTYTFAQLMDDVLGIADALQLDQFDVVGFGVGGAQAWMLAAYHPQRIRSLTSLLYPHPAAFAHGVQFEPSQKERFERLRRGFLSTDLRERTAVMLADNARNFRDFLTGVSLPEPFVERYVRRLQDQRLLMGAFAWERAISLEEFSRVPAVKVPSLLLWDETSVMARTTVYATAAYVLAPYHDIQIPDGGNFLLETSSERLISPIRGHLRSN